MSEHRALVTAPFRGEGLSILHGLAEVTLDPWIDHRPVRVLDGPSLVPLIVDAGADVLVVEADFVRGPVFDLPLVAVGTCRGDPSNVDVAAATARGVPVLHAPGRNADAVAELTIGLLLAVTRRIAVGDREVRSGTTGWDGTLPYQRFRAWQLAGRTAGIVGLGAVGRALRWRLEGLGMTVRTCDPYVAEATDDLAGLLACADVVSMHASVGLETTGMIGTEEFARMKPGAIFLNAARAELHDVDALVGALESGSVGGAGLDHFAGEHLPPDHPLVAMENVVLTPHIGGATYDTESNHSMQIATGLAQLFDGGRPPNLVNPEVLD